MRKTFNQKLFKEKIETAPAEVSDLTLNLEGDPLIIEIAERYKLDTLAVGGLVHELLLLIFGFISPDEYPKYLVENLKVKSDEAQLIYDEINLQLLSPIKQYFDSQQKMSFGNESVADKNTTSSAAILKEIENPTPSIKVAPTLQEAIGVVPELGGFKPTTTPVNPASAIADKLDKKLQGPTAELPKEIYHVKKPDPYHEPIE